MIPTAYKRLCRARKPPPILVVSGLPRSGTSMTMQMLAAGGIEVMTDRLRQADTDNPRGYFEFEPVKALAEADATSWLDAAHGKAIKIMEWNLHLGKPLDMTYDAAMATQFTRHLGQVKAWLRAPSHIDVLYIRHAEVLAEPPAAAERIQAFLGEPLQVEAMVVEVQPKLYRNRAADN